MTALTEPTAPATDEPPGPDAGTDAREAWCAVLSLHSDLDADEWAELTGDGDEPGSDPR